jgi:hypothetical protein
MNDEPRIPVDAFCDPKMSAQAINSGAAEGICARTQRRIVGLGRAVGTPQTMKKGVTKAAQPRQMASFSQPFLTKNVKIMTRNDSPTSDNPLCGKHLRALGAVTKYIYRLASGGLALAGRTSRLSARTGSGGDSRDGCLTKTSLEPMAQPQYSLAIIGVTTRSRRPAGDALPDGRMTVEIFHARQNVRRRYYF